MCHGRVFSRVSEPSVDCNLERLYLSDLDSEYRGQKTITFCVGLYNLIIFKNCCNDVSSVITDIYPL